MAQMSKTKELIGALKWIFLGFCVEGLGRKSRLSRQNRLQIFGFRVCLVGIKSSISR